MILNDFPIKVDNFSCKTKEGKTIISPVSLKFASRQLIALIGPSGSGKTTLLNSIAAKIQDGLIYEGSIKLSGVMKYVPQEEHLNGFYTVEGYLNHYVNLDYGFPEQSLKEQIVQQMMVETGLVSCKDTKVGDVFMKGLSGGQKRRLSVALELIGNPDIIILDEPTTGLDNVSAFHVVSMLKELTLQGKTIICSLHQPSSQIWELLDKVVFLSQSYLCYNGHPKDSLVYFATLGKVPPVNYNPCDFFMFQINSDFDPNIDAKKLSSDFLEWESRPKSLEEERPDDKQISQYVVEHHTSNHLIKQITSESNFFSKLLFVTQRYAVNSVLNPGIIAVRLFMYFMLCFCIGFMYFQLGTSYNDSDISSRSALLFYVAAFLVFMSIAVMPFFMIERGIFEKEIANKTILPVHYQLGMFISSIPAIALIAIVSSLLVNLIAGLNGFGGFFVILFLSLVCGEAVAMLVSLLVPHFIVGIAIVAGLYGIFMLCQGFLIVPSRIPGYFIWVYYIAFHTYSFQGFMVNEYQSIASFNSTIFPSGQAVLNFYGMQKASLWRSCLILMGYGLGLQLVIFFLMLYIYRKRSI